MVFHVDPFGMVFIINKLIEIIGVCKVNKNVIDTLDFVKFEIYGWFL